MKRAVELVAERVAKPQNVPLVQMNFAIPERTRDLGRRLAEENGWSQRYLLETAFEALEVLLAEAKATEAAYRPLPFSGAALDQIYERWLKPDDSGQVKAT